MIVRSILSKTFFNFFLVLMATLSVYLMFCVWEAKNINIRNIDTKIIQVTDPIFQPVPIKYDAKGNLVVKRGYTIFIERQSLRNNSFRAIAYRIVKDRDGSEYIVEIIKRPTNYLPQAKPSPNKSTYTIPHTIKPGCDIELYTLLELYSRYNLYVTILRPSLKTNVTKVCVE